MKITKKSCLYGSIWLMTLLPVLVAWSMAYFGIGLPDTTRNNGVLLASQIQVPENMQSKLEGKWSMLLVSRGCSEDCQQQLFRMQQLHKLLGKNYRRLQAIWLSDNTIPTDTDEQREVDMQQIMHLKNNILLDWFRKQDLPWQEHNIWLIDPLGNLVMRFPPELTGQQILDDINWLLTASRIG